MNSNPENAKPTGATPKVAELRSSGTTRPAQLRKLLTRKSGATIAQIQSSFGWQPHTARAAISGLRRRGEIVDRRDLPKGSVYRITSTKAAP